MSTFTQIRTKAVALEKQTEALLAQLSKIASSAGAVETPEETSIRTSISDILTSRDDTVAQLGRAAATEAPLPTSKSQQLQRHREVLQDHRSSFSKMCSRIADARNRSNLLVDIRSDITAHKQRDNVGNKNGGPTNADDYILDERRRVDSANSFADRLLQSAYETRDELNSQRARLLNATLGMQSALQRVPGINVLISKINTRRKRDTLILGVVISVCIVGLFMLG